MALTLAVMLGLPLAVGVVLLAIVRDMTARAANILSLVAAAGTAVAAVVAAFTRPVVDLPWVPAMGLRWSFEVDGIAVPLIILTAVLTVAIVWHSRDAEPVGGAAGTYYGSIMLVELGALATFTVRDAIGFFIAFELVLVPMWIIIGRFGDSHVSAQARSDAANRFLLFTVTGSGLMLLGLVTLVAVTGTSNLDALAAGRGAGLDSGTQLLIAVLLVLGLGIKVPIWPFHTWLPPAHTTAPTAGSVLLAAVLLKMGTYGLIRIAVPTVPEGFAVVAPALAACGVMGILWGGLACLVERDLKRLVAYSSVAHMGFVALGIASGTEVGLQAALFGNVAHGVISALLFFVVGGIKDRWLTADLEALPGALRETSPRFGFALVVGFAAALGLPGLIGFWGEFLAVYAAWSPAADLPTGFYQALAVGAVLGMTIAAAYSLRVLRVVWAGSQQKRGRGDAFGLEWAVLGLLIAATVLGGLMPGPLLDLTAPVARELLGVAGTDGVATP